MKKIYLFAAAATLFAACANDDLTVNEAPQAQIEEGAVSFDAYMQRAVTRAGNIGDLTTPQMQKNGISDGFGVFGYYTNNNDYDQLALPNFMWNQQVKANTAAPSFDYWTYTPVKYWPNEYGSNAISDDNDKVTFFAYAPYVPVGTDGKVDPGTGDVKNDTWGITGMTRNTTAGDPIIKYIGSFNKNYAVDLCWGVCQQDDWQIVQTGEKQKFDQGKPWLNVQRPAGVSQKLKFQFRHALAKMNIDVDAFVDGYDNTKTVDPNTRIWIRSVRFTGFTMKGALNLNNENPNEPYWMNYNGIGDLVADDDITVYDQRKDGKEGVSGATATNEKVGGLNTKFIQTEGLITGKPAAWTGTPTGVTNADPALPLFQDGGIFYVIPTGDPVEIEIVYDVETISPNLATTVSDGATPGSSIENRISKKILFGGAANTLEAGKAYDIHLHLGMNSVKFDAAVVDWDDMAAPDIDLPANMPAYAVDASTPNIDVPGADESFIFAVTGLKGGESVTAVVNNTAAGLGTLAKVEVNSTSDFTTGNNRANASGVAYVKVTDVTPNIYIVDRPVVDAVTVSPANTGGSFNLKVTQKAQPLSLTSATVTTNVFTLNSTRGSLSTLLGSTPATPATKPTSSTPASESDGIKVWLDGALLNIITTGTPTSAQVLLDWTGGTLTFKNALTSTQTVKLYLKAGDVPAETISLRGSDGAKLPTP